MSEKIYRVQMNSSGMPNFSTAIEIGTDISEYSDKLWKNAYERGKADRPQGEWIPCSERLPELTIHENEPFIGEWDNSEPVLIYHKDNKYEYPYLIAQYTNGFENNEVGWTEMNDANEVIDVMAWMPLPEPWKGADDEV